MTPELARQIGEAMECTPELLPYLPELLADFEELGASRRVILDLLRPLGLPSGARVLDLGCGNGAVLLALAAEFSFECVGVDAFAPFIETAQRAAEVRGLAEKCRFRCADLREVVAEHQNFDVAMLLALGAAIGTPAEIVGLLRGCVRPGGYMVIDDSFLGPGVEGAVPGYEGYSDHDDTVRRLTAHGDTVLREQLLVPEAVTHDYHTQLELIRRRAEEVLRKHPEATEAIGSYLRRQEREVELARGTVLNATWLLQRR
jgi:2-polyprenyl-3-methyl-5-hydroxy-6-metoxy-1,4-benzoquinol methylase